MADASCFISYSWDHDEHVAWVLRLAKDLRLNGAKVDIDRDVSPGSSLTAFMETSVRESDFVVMVCTPAFARRANERAGGVGYESQIVTGELYESVLSDKFVPILRGGRAK